MEFTLSFGSLEGKDIEERTPKEALSLPCSTENNFGERIETPLEIACNIAIIEQHGNG